ncbi:SnoRNA binding protein [Acidilobus saccharovorans 345-15]|uniref:SnoRNA binding protein n=1 Tax=Acidilobus saccharovorans (strain DSM 16705 / JCM 18335 / VKM B-2471 / 345-15) TaxID=666510 RepID=D9Q330_ACIS3|nr:SnoRNA binding protein [Acidilobus saccharovorans 345-15]
MKGLKIYIVDTIAGSYAVDESGKELAFEPLPKSFDDLVAEAIKISRGELSEAFIKLADKVKQLSPEEVIVESEEEAKYLNQQGLRATVSEGNQVALSVRSRIPQLLIESELIKSDSEAPAFELNVAFEFTRRGLMGAAKKRDLLAAHSIRTIDDIDKTVNLFVNRLREWYSVNFPELNDIVEDHRLYVKLVAELGDRENFTEDRLKDLRVPPQLAEKIASAAKRSIGADLSEHDLEAIKTFAGIILQLYDLRDQLEGYVNRVMKEVAPNITELVGPLLGARLISLAGGLDRLATMPASTIQVLGAEKALFRALRTGGRPPKHGIIFQYPEIFRAPKWQRGKIARALAAKLAIAAKVDAFSGRFIGDRLNSELQQRIAEIKKVYASPPKRKEAPQAPQRGQRPPRRHGRGGRGGKGRR